MQFILVPRMSAVLDSLVSYSRLFIQTLIAIQFLVRYQVKVMHFVVIFGRIDTITLRFRLGKWRTVAVAFSHKQIHFFRVFPSTNEILISNSVLQRQEIGKVYQMIVDPFVLSPANMCRNARLRLLHLIRELR